MSINFFKRFAVATIFLIALSLCAKNKDSSSESTLNNNPNLIVILTDDQGYSDVGCFGAKGFSTPNLDQMAKKGVRFTDFYAAPTCSPASLICSHKY